MESITSVACLSKHVDKRDGRVCVASVIFSFLVYFFLFIFFFNEAKLGSKAYVIRILIIID